MAIKLRCPCGELLQSADNSVATVRCPACQTLLRIPVAARPTVAPPKATAATPPPLPGSNTYAVESVRRCPECRKEWLQKTVLCVECGYDFRTGRRRKRAYHAREDSIEVGAPSIGSYTRCTVRRDGEGTLALIIQSWLLWVSTGTTTIPLRDYDAVATDYQLQYGDHQNFDMYYLELQGPCVSPRQFWSGGRESEMHALVDLLQKRAGLMVRRN